mmetsp:Transcript_37501/g.110768  ORF Transcript_37501/g.110768 Transcript_37501/m.110768 type:complete len:113 (-) Transcript_37501:73-411(-)
MGHEGGTGNGSGTGQEGCSCCSLCSAVASPAATAAAVAAATCVRVNCITSPPRQVQLLQNREVKQRQQAQQEPAVRTARDRTACGAAGTAAVVQVAWRLTAGILARAMAGDV